jgi:hypothetical protein
MGKLLKARNAREYIDNALRACLPPGVPPSYQSIDAAHYTGFGRRLEAFGTVTMFDGAPAKVRVWQYAHEAYAHEWTEMNGGDCSFEDGAWVRIDRATGTPVLPLLAEIERLTA